MPITDDLSDVFILFLLEVVSLSVDNDVDDDGVVDLSHVDKSDRHVEIISVTSALDMIFLSF